MVAYYNEIDPFAAQWLRNLVAAGHIAPGDVDERSIVDVRADDLRGYRQCHFFAGIGVWSHALRLAGWDDEREIWTGSCPCQSFSAAGSGRGFDDERHLWPHFFRLIREQRPRTVFGEQVASKDGLAWLDFVCADMESEGYAIAPLDLCAAGFGAPHIRQRLYFVADSLRDTTRQHARELSGDESKHDVGPAHGDNGSWNRGAVDELADATTRGLGIDGSASRQRGHAAQCVADGVVVNTHSGRLVERDARERGVPITDANSAACGMGNAELHGSLAERESGAAQDEGRLLESQRSGADGGLADAERDGGRTDESQRQAQGRAADGRPCATNGFWRDADWLSCRDGKARPIESGIEPLVDGAPARVGRLRAYGNAIVAPVAAEFVSAYMDIA